MDQVLDSDLAKILPTCPVCFETYNDAAVRPIILDCSNGHTTCQVCAIEIYRGACMDQTGGYTLRHQMEFDRGFRCPICQEQILHFSPSRLTTNIELLKLLRDLSAYSKSMRVVANPVTCSRCGEKGLEERYRVCLECAGTAAFANADKFDLNKVNDVALCCHCVLLLHQGPGHTIEHLVVFKLHRSSASRQVLTTELHKAGETFQRDWKFAKDALQKRVELATKMLGQVFHSTSVVREVQPVLRVAKTELLSELGNLVNTLTSLKDSLKIQLKANESRYQDNMRRNQHYLLKFDNEKTVGDSVNIKSSSLFCEYEAIIKNSSQYRLCVRFQQMSSSSGGSEKSSAIHVILNTDESINVPVKTMRGNSVDVVATYFILAVADVTADAVELFSELEKGRGGLIKEYFLVPPAH